MSMPNQIRTCYLLIATIALTPVILMNSASANPLTQSKNPSKLSLSKFVYTPIQLPANGQVTDTLSERDIPTGDGGFARDYAIKLTAGDRVEIDVTSESFDTVVILLTADGKSIGKNDDGPDGTSNSLLFTRIKDSGTYIIRVQGFGETSSGEFKLKVSKLKESK